MISKYFKRFISSFHVYHGFSRILSLELNGGAVLILELFVQKIQGQ